MEQFFLTFVNRNLDCAQLFDFKNNAESSILNVCHCVHVNVIVQDR